MRDEGGLHRMQAVAIGEPFYRGDVAVYLHHGQRQAGIDAAAIDQHRARPALATVASLLGAGQTQLLPQRVEQRGTGFDRQHMQHAVDAQFDGPGRRCRGGGRGRVCGRG